jgi:hypothetical protein
MADVKNIFALSHWTTLLDIALHLVEQNSSVSFLNLTYKKRIYFQLAKHIEPKVFITLLKTALYFIASNFYFYNFQPTD